MRPVFHLRFSGCPHALRMLLVLLCVLVPLQVSASQEFMNTTSQNAQEPMSPADIFLEKAKATQNQRPKNVSLETMAGAMIMMGFRGAELPPGDPFLRALQGDLFSHVILFDRDLLTQTSRNIGSPEELKALTTTLQKASSGPLFIAVDQEGGKVRRLKTEMGYMDLPAAKSLGRDSPDNTRGLARRLGREMAALGINVNMAPVVDVDTNPLNPTIGKLGRSFSADPSVVSQHALAFGKALQAEGVIPVLKHFPGHGSSTADSHIGIADITTTWNSQSDLKPYVDAIRSGWSGMIMVGHLSHKGLDSQYPATLSKKIVQDLLRSTLGWSGIVLSDDLQMKAITDHYTLEEVISLAVNAGVDILVFGNNLQWDEALPQKVHETLVRLVREGKIPRERIKESWDRITGSYYTYSNIYLGVDKPQLSHIR